MKFILKCRKLNPLNADYAIEVGAQYLMQDETEKAYSVFQEASVLDESKIETLTGMIQCKILQGVLDDAAQ